MKSVVDLIKGSRDGRQTTVRGHELKIGDTLHFLTDVEAIDLSIPMANTPTINTICTYVIFERYNEPRVNRSNLIVYKAIYLDPTLWRF